MTETLANGYSSESAQRELSNEYQYDRVSLHPCAMTKVASALEGLLSSHKKVHSVWLFTRYLSNDGRYTYNLGYLYLCQWIGSMCHGSLSITLQIMA